jgi:hypothetical protein
MKRNNRGLYLAVCLFTAAFLLFGWVVTQLLQGDTSAAVAQASPTNPPLPSITGVVEEPTAEPTVTMTVLEVETVDRDQARANSDLIRAAAAAVSPDCQTLEVDFSKGDTSITVQSNSHVTFMPRDFLIFGLFVILEGENIQSIDQGFMYARTPPSFELTKLAYVMFNVEPLQLDTPIIPAGEYALRLLEPVSFRDGREQEFVGDDLVGHFASAQEVFRAGNVIDVFICPTN